MQLNELSNSKRIQKQLYPETLKERSQMFRVSIRRDQNKAEFTRKRSLLTRAPLSEGRKTAEIRALVRH